MANSQHLTDVVFTGFDSAWGGRQRGAICDLHGEVSNGRVCLRIEDAPISVTWEDACLRFANCYSEWPNHMVAIDQGLVVNNSVGMRTVERNLARALMLDFGCGAYPSNTSNLSCYGPLAGIWRLLGTLITGGYLHNPLSVANRSPGRYFFECYPHPALIGIFNLDRALPYKVHRRDADAWEELLGLLRSLSNSDLDLSIVNVGDHVPATLGQTKSNEDMLDSIIAAYTAAYFWWYGTKRSIVLGSLTDGYIVTPYSERTLARFRAVFRDDELNAAGTAPVSLAPCLPPATSCLASSPAPDDRSAPAKIGSIPPESENVVDLVATDTGNLWCNANQWMIRERCEEWRLVVRFIDVDGEPSVVFVPFDNQGSKQGGMKPGRDDESVWKFITEGVSRNNRRTFRVEHRYERL